MDGIIVGIKIGVDFSDGICEFGLVFLVLYMNFFLVFYFIEDLRLVLEMLEFF